MARETIRPKVVKTCRRCGCVGTEHHTSMCKGRIITWSWCVVCERARKAAYYRKVRAEDGPAAARLRESSRKYDHTPRGRTRTARYRKTPHGREAHRRASQRYCASVANDSITQQKRRATTALNAAIRRGAIVPPLNCNRCGEYAPRGIKHKHGVEGHHFAGYDEANYLVIEFLCHSCHREIEGRDGTAH